MQLYKVWREGSNIHKLFYRNVIFFERAHISWKILSLGLALCLCKCQR